MSGKIVVSGVGCCLVDLLYNNIDFGSNAILPFLSKKRGDGGLTPGKLVFRDEFEKYCGESLDLIISKITGGRKYDKINIGGPSIVSLIHLAQITDPEKCEVRFYGRGGKDEKGKYLLSSLKKTPVILKDLKLIDNRTPSTVVLSDPSFNSGHGERMFINSIGAAWDYKPDELDDDFFNSDIVVFGGTALVPQIHDKLTSLLKRAKSKGAVTVVNTVFDFRNEKTDPSKKWPIGESDESYQFIDLLITDKEEACRLSNKQNSPDAIQFFRDKKISSVIITDGPNDILAYSNGNFFSSTGIMEMPVSQRIKDELKSHRSGDTTGCGDNFTGGIIASLVAQLQNSISPFDLREACCYGIVSGGFTCFYMGGTWFEKKAGEKLNKIKPYYESYRKQISIDNRKIVIFGAGKIGRSFIGQLFGTAGYNIVFIDIDPVIVSGLNDQGGYKVIAKGGKDEEIIVKNVQAILESDKMKVAEAVSTAGILAVSVGKNAVQNVIPLIASGLKIRHIQNPTHPIDIIIAENMIAAADFMGKQLIKNLPSDYPFEKLVGLVETSIGKMVPIITKAELRKDPLMVYCEPYNTLILDGKAFKTPVPEITGLAPKDNIKAWVDRKAFIHNLGHAAAAYFGFYRHPSSVFMYEVLDDNEVLKFTREVMLQSADILQDAYPHDFTVIDLEEHIDDLLQRFRNRSLRDTIFRVGHDLPRKLNRSDRFMGAIQLSVKHNKPYDKILKAMSYGLFFKAKDNEGNLFPADVTFLHALSSDFEKTLINYLDLDAEEDWIVIEKLKLIYENNNKPGTDRSYCIRS